MKMELNIKMESKTYQYRKVTKPLLERKRRARINKCLDDLKDLMIECIRQQGENIARLEKADILELTVEHLRKIKRNKEIKSTSTSMNNNNNNNIDCFKSGYIHAANEVSRALASLPRVDIELGTKLMTHLGHRLNQIQNQPQQQNEIIITKRNVVSSAPAPLRVVTSPLSVNCDSSSSDNYYHSNTMMISPGSSSGYGSDSDYSGSLSSPNQHLQVKNIWRPW